MRAIDSTATRDPRVINYLRQNRISAVCDRRAWGTNVDTGRVVIWWAVTSFLGL
jgi:hypothetical protein